MSDSWEPKGTPTPIKKKLKVKHVSSCAAQNTWSMDQSMHFKFPPHSPLSPAESTSPVNTQQDGLRCPVCKGVLKDPVSITCGHSYCRQCIASFWAQPNQAGYYACPKCRKRFRTRPDISSKKAPMPQQSQLVCGSSASAGPTPCDFCLTQKSSAVKFCATCMASYCETHVRQHYTVPVLQRHRLVEAAQHLEQVICSRHNRALEMFCRTDCVSVCCLCAVLEHRHHNVLVDIPKQTETSNSQRPGTPMVRGRQMPTVDAEVENRELRMKNKLQQEVIMQQRKVEAHQKSKGVERDKRHEEELQEMAQSISTLETRNAKLKRYNNRLTKKLAKLNKSSHQPSSGHPMIPEANHCKRHPLTARVVLDLATAHRRLMLSEDRRRVKLARCPRTSWNRQQGLDGQPFVLGMKGFSSGRWFWQVGVNNRWIIGVARASAQRTGNVIFYPSHGYWCLSRSIQFSALMTPLKCLPESSVPRELGVCLDVDERWVSFYNAQSKAHIYRFTNMDIGEGENIYPLFSTHDEEQEIKIRKQPVPHCPVFVSD